MTGAAIGWGLVVTQPLSERRALTHLLRQEYECYWPRVKSVRVVGGRKIEVPQGLFSRYIFVKLAGRWRSLLGTFGISQVVLVGDEPAVVSDSVVQELKAREDKEGFIVLPSKDRMLRFNQTVRVTGGKFSGHIGLYQGMSSRQREIVLLNILGRSVRVELAAGDLTY